MRTIRLSTLSALLAVLLTVPVTAGEAPQQDPLQVAWKQRHVDRVVQELRARDTSHLTDAQRKARVENIARLEAYGKRAVFPIDNRWTGLAIPYLIDDQGTRCALAHLIDRSGANDLLLDMAKGHNNAFLPELAKDKRLVAWLQAQGLTVEEAAFIQAPGYVDPVDRRPTDDPTGDDTGTPDPSRRVPTSGVTPQTRGRAATASPDVTWEDWWSLNRHAFSNVREVYHRVVATGPGAADARPHRPTSDEVQKVVLPLLQEQAGDKDIRATALMAWARAVQPADAEATVAAVLDYLKSKDAPYRDLLILALGVAGHESAVAPLLEIVKDSKAGRKSLRSTQSLSDRVRAFGAIALGELGDVRGIPVLLDVLAKEKSGAADLRSCCVAALGVLSSQAEAMDQAKVNQTLVGALRKRSWPDEALSTIPAALASSHSAMAPQLVDHLARFRKPAAARQSAALALPISESKLTPALADTLIGVIRRDPDDMARRFALISLGELAATTSDPAVRAKLHTFYEGGFRGVHIKGMDRPWMYLSAGLFVRSCPEAEAGKLPAALLKIVKKGASVDQRASAALALAIVGRGNVVDELRLELKGSGNDHYRGYLAEALGMLRDPASRDLLLEMVRTDKSDHVRYHAAMGLGFMADRTVVTELVDALGNVHSFRVKGAIARVIGEIGDKRALLPLMNMARDKKADTWTRRRALAALGMIAEDADQGWTARFRRGANLRYATPTLRQVLGIF